MSPGEPLTLTVFPDAGRLERALVTASRAQGFVDVSRSMTFSQLVETCVGSRWLETGERLVDGWTVRAVTAQAAALRGREVFSELSGGVDFAFQLDTIRSELFLNHVTPAALADVASRMGDRTGRKAGAIAAILEHVDRVLAEKRWVDPRAVIAAAASWLGERGLPDSLSRFERVELRDLHDLPPSRLVFVDALAHAVTSGGAGFRLIVPWTGNRHTDAFVGGIARFFERRWEKLARAELVLEGGDGERAYALRSLFSADEQQGGLPGVQVVSCPTPRDEALAIAHGVRRRLDAGTPPERIAIVFREVDGDAELVTEALSAVGVPVRARLSTPLSASTPARLALSLLELEDDGFPVDDVAPLLESRAVPGVSAGLPPVRGLLAEAGVRDDRVGARDGKGAFAVRLSALQERRALEAESRPSLWPAVHEVEALRAAVTRLFRLVRSIAARGPAGALLEAWWSALGQLGLAASLTAPARTRTALDAEVDRAVATDQAALDALAALVRSLRTAFERSGLASVVMERRTLLRWLSLAAGQTSVVGRTPRAGAVWLLDARALPGSRFEACFVGGLVDGRFPGRATATPLLSADERSELNAVAGTPYFRAAASDDGVALPLELAEDRLLFIQALTCAPDVTLLAARVDRRGKEALRSPFVDALERVCRPVSVVRAHHAAPPLDDVVTRDELLVRSALELFSPVETRQSPRDPRASGLADALGAEPALSRAQVASAIEVERLRFFTNPEAQPGRFSGRVDGALLERLAPALEWSEARPVSASQLEVWAQCHFLGLSRRILRLEEDEAASEELGHRAVGELLHAALKRLLPALKHAGQWPPAQTQRALVASALDRALEGAVDEVRQAHPLGHHLLFEINVERARSDLLTLLFEPAINPFTGATPRDFERPFGTKGAPSVVLPPALPHERPVALTGTIDRLDVSPGQVAVVDYKLSRPGTPKARLDALTIADFQLPLYLYAATQLEPGKTVDAAWVGLRRSEALVLSRVLRDAPYSLADVLAVDLERRRAMAEEGHPNLANAVHGLQRSLRQGDFGARPLDCQYCHVRSVCRISARRLFDGPEVE